MWSLNLSKTLPGGMFRGSAHLYDESGLLVAEIKGARFRQATRELLTVSDDVNPADLLFEVAWRPCCCPSHALKRDPADYLPTLEQIEKRLQAELVEDPMMTMRRLKLSLVSIDSARSTSLARLRNSAGIRRSAIDSRRKR